MSGINWQLVRNPLGHISHYEAHGLLSGFIGQVWFNGLDDWHWVLRTSTGGFLAEGNQETQPMAEIALYRAAASRELVSS